MKGKDIKAIIRGHLISVHIMPRKLKMVGDDFFKTRYYTIIVGEKQVSFKQGNDIRTFIYEDVKDFYLKNNDTFVFVVGNKEELRFTIAKPIFKKEQRPIKN